MVEKKNFSSLSRLHILLIISIVCHLVFGFPIMYAPSPFYYKIGVSKKS